MAKLFGRLFGERGAVTRTASREITSRLETWDGEIRTELDADGNFAVYIGPKNSPNICIAEGNVNDGKRMLYCPALYQDNQDLEKVTS